MRGFGDSEEAGLKSCATTGIPMVLEPTTEIPMVLEATTDMSMVLVAQVFRPAHPNP
jgi:hypothetical protein